MIRFWKSLDRRRKRGLVAALAFIGFVQVAMVPQLWASLDGDDRPGFGVGQRSVMMLESRHSVLREYSPAPVAGTIEVTVAAEHEGARTVVVAYRDHWREELARATAEVGDDGRVSIDLEQETEAPRPWWRCRSFEETPCTAYAVELRTLRVEAKLDDGGIVRVESLSAGNAHLIRERAGKEQRDDAGRWTRYELADAFAIELAAPPPAT